MPLNGPIVWRSGTRQGVCQVRDVSPTGAGFEAPADKAPIMGQELSLRMMIDPQISWQVADSARVVCHVPGTDGLMHVGVMFLDST